MPIDNVSQIVELFEKTIENSDIECRCDEIFKRRVQLGTRAQKSLVNTAKRVFSH